MTIDLNQLENRLWATANQMWANTGLKPSGNLSQPHD